MPDDGQYGYVKVPSSIYTAQLLSGFARERIARFPDLSSPMRRGEEVASTDTDISGKLPSTAGRSTDDSGNRIGENENGG